MCEEESPVKALNFLQIQVSSVVDHSNTKETEMFRLLLTHLLTPSPSPLLSSSSKGQSRPHSTSTPSSASSIEHEDSREVSTRPTKRSRAEREDSGVWTNEIPVEGDSFEVGGGAQMLRDMVDPLEAIIRGGVGGGEGVAESSSATMSTLMGARYSQRTEVFEGILNFINDGEKQPSESLLDLVERDRCRSEVV